MTRRSDELLGDYEARPWPFFRRVFADSLDALAPSPYLLGLVEIDVTDARRCVREQRRTGRPVTFQALVLKSLALALAESPELNAIPTRRALYVFRDVDINLPLELEVDGIRFPRQVVVRRANEKSVDEITDAAGRFAASGDTGVEDARAQRLLRTMSLVPRGVRRAAIRALAADPLRVKRSYGTIHFTTVSGYATAPGFVIPCLVRGNALDVTCGSVVRRPVARDGAVEVREVLSVTLMFHHQVVDGVPAARFTRRLQRAVESAEALVTDGTS